VGKVLPTPYPGQPMDEYREQLINFQKNYWSFLKSSKGGSKFIPLPPLTLIKKTKEMSSRKLSEHVEEELFNKEKRVVTPKKSTPSASQEIKEGENPVKKKKPYYRKKYNKPKPVEILTPKPVNNYWFIKGLLVGIVTTAIICHIIYSI
jgi:hypothetical protein